MKGGLLVAGTTSDAGKSVLTAGLCRWLARQGVRVAPFKAQNMSLNSFVTPDGAEIGRAQAMQAAAAGIEPDARMNPVLRSAEINLRDADIANMGLARAAGLPVVVVGDIDRGGVFAALYGPWRCWIRRTRPWSAALSSTSSAAIPACSPPGCGCSPA